MIRLVIFDFDGTIVDTKAIYYNSIHNHLVSFGLSRKKIDEAIDLGLNLGETLKRLVPSFFYKWWIRRKIMKDVLKEASRVKKCHDAGHINDVKIKKILVSNSLSDFVMPVVKHLKLGRYFSGIYCADKFNNKADFIKLYLKLHGIRPNETFYVGDRVADVELAKKINIHSIIIRGRCAWNSQKELIKAKPEFIVPDLRDVKRIVERFRG
jgi:phosphoglycolate phosphatase-like HAD superfamily hydrolase